MLNLFESAAYVYYLFVVYRHGVSMGSFAGRGGGRQKKAQKGIRWFLLDEKVVPGGKGATALLIAYSASLMTLGKTVLYCELMSEYP